MNLLIKAPSKKRRIKLWNIAGRNIECRVSRGRPWCSGPRREARVWVAAVAASLQMREGEPREDE
ncbi:hypothetical protein E2C01_061943 [Portunus trituberculatus]|uniref:Uncharacterized protein n=1 Tax=Portunus trituberculatus TaxID=210409 RepID=A0A5B7H6M2_PORTR|nr:hypothetical protein [Portunus trituberculatus]